MTVKRVRLRDARLDERLEADGFVRVPFLGDAAVRRLRDLWAEIGPVAPDGIYSNIHDLAPEVNRRVDRLITEEFAEPARRLFLDAHLGGASFLVKGTGPNSASTLHQDWNNVDESRWQSISIWCPLVDVDEHNGALQVLPGSHRCRPSIRSLDTPSLYLDLDESLEPHLQCVPASAGDAVLYAHNLFHGSKPNLSSEVRVSAVSGVVPVGAPLVHYRRDPSAPGAGFEVLQVERDFYFSGVPDLKEGRVPPTASLVGRVVVDRPTLTSADVLEPAALGLEG